MRWSMPRVEQGHDRKTRQVGMVGMEEGRLRIVEKPESSEHVKLPAS